MTIDNIAMVIVVAVIVLDKVMGMLKQRGIDLHKIAKQIDSLYELHNVKDQDGVPVWYFRKSLDEVLHKLAEYMERSDRRQELEAARMDQRDQVMERLTSSLGALEKRLTKGDEL